MAILVKYQTGENVVSGKIPEEKRTISGSEILAVLDSISAVLDGKHASVNFFAAHMRAQVMDMHMCAHTHMFSVYLSLSFPFPLPSLAFFRVGLFSSFSFLLVSLSFSHMARIQQQKHNYPKSHFGHDEQYSK